MTTEELRIVLVGESKIDHDKMLNELRMDQTVSINSSRLINWIVHDYFENFYPKRKAKILKAHFNSRKCVLEAMKKNDPKEVSRALRELARNLDPKEKLVPEEERPA
jgi:hypothetical protein